MRRPRAAGAAARIWQLVLLARDLRALARCSPRPGCVPHFLFADDNQAAFFFGEPLKIFSAHRPTGSVERRHLSRTWASRCSRRCWPSRSAPCSGLGIGLWLALSPDAPRRCSIPYIKAMNAMPRVILAPIFAVWFGLGIGSQGGARRDAGVLHRVLQRLPGRQGSEPGGARQRAHAGRVPAPAAAPRLPAVGATSWVFARACTRPWAWPSSARWWASTSARRKGVGYLILQAEGAFDINTVFAGILVLTVFALVLDYVVTRIESRLLVWRPQHRRDRAALSVSCLCASAARASSFP